MCFAHKTFKVYSALVLICIAILSPAVGMEDNNGQQKEQWPLVKTAGLITAVGVAVYAGWSLGKQAYKEYCTSTLLAVLKKNTPAQNEVASIKSFLHWNADVNQKDSQGKNALDCAFEKQEPAIFKLLLPQATDETKWDLLVLLRKNEHKKSLHNYTRLILESGIGRAVFREDENGQTLLHYFANKNCLQEIRLLCEKSKLLENFECGSLAETDKTRKTPLQYAIDNKNIEMIAYLVETYDKHNKLYKRKECYNAHLDYALDKGMLGAVRIFIERGASVNRYNSLGITPLCRAIERHSNWIVRLLLKDHAWLDSFLHKKNNYVILSPLEYAITYGNISAIKLLIKASKEYQRQDAHDSLIISENQLGWCLIYAITKQDIQAIKLLLTTGIDINKEYDSSLPLFCAIETGMSEIVSLLIAHNASVNTYKERVYTPVHHAIEKNHNQALEALMRAGADIHKGADKSGICALHVAADCGNSEAVEALLRAGANVNIQTNAFNMLEFEINEQPAPAFVILVDKLTPLHYAASRNSKEIVKLLIGADANLKLKAVINEDAVTPYDVAVANNNLEIAQLLYDDKDDNKPNPDGFRAVCRQAAKEKLGCKNIYVGIQLQRLGVPCSLRKSIEELHNKKTTPNNQIAQKNNLRVAQEVTSLPNKIKLLLKKKKVITHPQSGWLDGC